jgi:hypothetical protein
LTKGESVSAPCRWKKHGLPSPAGQRTKLIGRPAISASERSDFLVVVGKIALGDGGARIELFVGMGQRDFVVAFGYLFFVRGGFLHRWRLFFFAGLSSRKPWKEGWRITPSWVHSVKFTWATSSGLAKTAPLRAGRGIDLNGAVTGDPVLDFSGLTHDQGAVLHEVTVDTYVEGRGDEAREVKRVRFKLCDKLGALRDLGRHHKLFTDRKELDVGETLESLIARSHREKRK